MKNNHPNFRVPGFTPQTQKHPDFTFRGWKHQDHNSVRWADWREKPICWDLPWFTNWLIYHDLPWFYHDLPWFTMIYHDLTICWSHFWETTGWCLTNNWGMDRILALISPKYLIDFSDEFWDSAVPIQTRDIPNKSSWARMGARPPVHKTLFCVSLRLISLKIWGTDLSRQAVW